MKHKHTGTITSIGDSYSSPDHVRISVAHGNKKKPKKGEVSYGGDSRPSSENAGRPAVQHSGASGREVTAIDCTSRNLMLSSPLLSYEE